MSDFETLPDRKNTSSQKWDVDRVHDQIPMSVADADFYAPSFIMDAIKERTDQRVFGYSIWPKACVDITVQWANAQHGWIIDPDSITLCNGVLTGLSAAMRAVLKEGEGVVINTPSYPPFKSITQANGYSAIECPMVLDGKRYTINYVELEAHLQIPSTKVLILCNPHNPVGTVFTKSELYQLSTLCNKHNVTVISDEIHSDLAHSGSKHTPFAALGATASQNSISLISPSKTFNTAGLPAAAIVCESPEVRARIGNSLKSFGNYLPSAFSVACYEAAYRLGAPYVQLFIERIQENINLACNYINQHCTPLSAHLPEATYLLWIDCRKLNMSDVEVDELFRHKARLILQSGSLFGSVGSGFVRMNIACPKPLLIQALERIKAALS